tara:strand:+ start:690 stop:902 length:213 start_codon:yes stop_codon:yes gene_type:complete
MKREVIHDSEEDRKKGRKYWRKKGWFVGKNWEMYQDESLWGKWYCFYVYKKQYHLFEKKWDDIEEHDYNI